METFIKNRKGLKLFISVSKPQKFPQGLVFVVHGLGSHSGRPTPTVTAKTFLENGYTTVKIDVSNSSGKSGGRLENATLSNYLHDLEDSITWAKKQKWYKEPFFLAGSSFGAMTVCWYTANHNKKVKGVVLVAFPVSGKLAASTKFSKLELQNLKKQGYIPRNDQGISYKLPWSHMEDRFKYNLLTKAHKLSMPVLDIVGELDSGAPPKNQKLFLKKVTGKKTLYIIKGCPHIIRKPGHLKQVSKTINSWLKNNF